MLGPDDSSQCQWGYPRPRRSLRTEVDLEPSAGAPHVSQGPSDPWPVRFVWLVPEHQQPEVILEQRVEGFTWGCLAFPNPIDGRPHHGGA